MTLTGTQVEVDGRSALRFERHLGHSVERVWRAVSEPAELAQWYPGVPAEAEWTLEPGAEFGNTAEAAGGRFLEVEPPRLLAFSWGTEIFRFELSPEGEGCTLVFTHVIDDPTRTAQHAAGWEAYLRRLDVHLDGGFLDEMEAHQGWIEVHDRYAESFGVDPTPGREMFARMTAT